MRHASRLWTLRQTLRHKPEDAELQVRIAWRPTQWLELEIAVLKTNLKCSLLWFLHFAPPHDVAAGWSEATRVVLLRALDTASSPTEERNASRDAPSVNPAQRLLTAAAGAGGNWEVAVRFN